jgi:hypothetical protein
MNALAHGDQKGHNIDYPVGADCNCPNECEEVIYNSEISTAPIYLEHSDTLGRTIHQLERHVKDLNKSFHFNLKVGT